MFKKSKILLLVLVLFLTTACVERGQKINPIFTQNSKTTIFHKESNTTTSFHPEYALKCKAKQSKNEKLKNNISGTFLLVIGILIFL